MPMSDDEVYDYQQTVCETIDNVLALAMPSLTGGGVAVCLTISTARLLSYAAVHEHKLPEEVAALLDLYCAELRTLTLELINHHDTGC